MASAHLSPISYPLPVFRSAAPIKETQPLRPGQVKAIQVWAKTHSFSSNERIQGYMEDVFGIDLPQTIIEKYKKAWGLKKTYAHPLRPDQVSTLKDWAKTNPAVTNSEIQTYIKNSFGVEYAARSIRRYKEEWGFKKTCGHPHPLQPDQVSKLKAWAKTNLTATWQQIQKHIEETFDVKLTQHVVGRHRKNWGFTVKVRARPLRPEEVKILQIWAKTNKGASIREIQKHIEEDFGVTCSEATIQNHKADWGLNFKNKEIKTLKKWAQKYKSAKNEEIQAYIKKTFGFDFSEESIEENKRAWGFAVQAPKKQTSLLLPGQVKALKDWAKEHKSAKNEEIQKYIEETFDVKYSVRTVQKKKTAWGFIPLIFNGASLLRLDQVKTLKEWAKKHKSAKNEEIQKYIEKTFDVKYSQRSIRRHKAEWGFTVADSLPKLIPTADLPNDLLIEEFEQGALALDFPPIFVDD